MPTAFLPFPEVVTAGNRMSMVQKLEIRAGWNSNSYNFVALARLPYPAAAFNEVYNNEIPYSGSSIPTYPRMTEPGTDQAEASTSRSRSSSATTHVRLLIPDDDPPVRRRPRMTGYPTNRHRRHAW